MTKPIFCLLPAKIAFWGVVGVFCQTAYADSREDAVAMMDNLRQAGIHIKVPAEMESIEATFSKAEQYTQIKDSKNATSNYQLVIQKASILKSKYQTKEPVAVPQNMSFKTAAAVEKSDATVPGKSVAISSPIQITVDSTTILRMEQRDLGTQKQNYVPFFQLLGLDVDKLADGNLSMHFNGWFRADLADKSYNNDTTAGSLSYGYLRYRFKEANADIRAGRLFVREGIINEQIDGVSARTNLPYGFGISAFGGANVHNSNLFNETSDGKGSSIFGGRINYRYRGIFEVGLSALHESKAPVLVNYINGNHRLVGADLWYNPHKMIELVGRSSYNSDIKKIAEHSYLLNIRPLERLVVGIEFNEQHDQSYLYSWTMYSKAALNPSDKSRSVGGSGSYDINKSVNISVDYKHYTRELGNADRYGFNTKMSFLDNMLRSGGGYHYLRAGDGFAISGTNGASYHELRGYTMYDTKTYFAALDLMGYFFKEKIFNKSSAWEMIASVGYHFRPNLSLSGDVSYGRNPQFTEEIKGLLKLTYNTNFDLKGGK